MSLTAYPLRPAVDATALIVFKGSPNVTVDWDLTGPGTLEPKSPCTDERGVAAALFTPAATGTVTVSVTHA
jgi:hypothetical protein